MQTKTPTFIRTSKILIDEFARKLANFAEILSTMMETV